MCFCITDPHQAKSVLLSAVLPSLCPSIPLIVIRECLFLKRTDPHMSVFFLKLFNCIYVNQLLSAWLMMSNHLVEGQKSVAHKNPRINENSTGEEEEAKKTAMYCMNCC